MWRGVQDAASRTLQLAVLPCLLACIADAARAAPAHAPKLETFEYRDVKLLPGLLQTRFELNRKYLLSLPVERLLYPYYKEAIIKVPANVEPLGGWESPAIDVRGHFLGHYLSACARIINATNDPDLKANADQVVSELERCQRANGNGYAGPIPEKVFTALESGRFSDVWAPYYVIHKVLMGLYEMHRYTGNQQALHVATGLADYIYARTSKLTDPVMTKTLEVEQGGMAEVLYDLAAVTENPKYGELAQRFEDAHILDPLAANQDRLTGVHANTTIPKIYGAMRAFEVTGQPRYFDMGRNFWTILTGTRTYATGGSNNKEFWPDPKQLSQTLTEANQETCTSYNMMWLSRYLLRWTGASQYGDYIERNLYNGIVSAQNPEDGQFLYFTPMRAGSTKKFGTPLNSFWCCYGTGVQAFADLGGSIYFHDDRNLVVNLFTPSEVTWHRPEGAVKLVQRTGYPEEAATHLTVQPATPMRFGLQIRVPSWATKAFEVKINGAAADLNARAGSYLTLDREWKPGDTVDVEMPMTLHAEPMRDDPQLTAILYGPLTLAGLVFEDVTFQGKRDRPDTWLHQVPEKEWTRTYRVPKPTRFLPEYIDYAHHPAMTFQTSAPNSQVKFIALYNIVSEPYGIYFRVKE